MIGPEKQPFGSQPNANFGFEKVKVLKWKDLAPRARFELATLRLTAAGKKS